ncbi:MAG: hypothetical protein EXR74_05185 [Bdellovibrionales bacterium]|nr:hypothetical protein [Bdellovibrionales bacterium]
MKMKLKLNTIGTHLIGLLCVMGTSHLLLAEVAEFTLSEKLLNQLEFTSSKTEPFIKNGRRVEPNITIKVTPQIGNSSADGRVNLNVALTGTSTSRSSTPVGRRHSVEATVDTDIDASFKQEIMLGQDKTQVGRFQSEIKLTPTRISVDNNFKLLRRFVNRKASEKAPIQIAEELPKERTDLSDGVKGEIDKGTRQAKELVDSTLEILGTVFTEEERLPFQAKLSTETGKEGKLKLVVSDKLKAQQRDPKPEFENKDQLMATAVFHQDLLTQTIAAEIAGKELKLSQLRKVLCSPKITKLINFCDTSKVNSPTGLSLLFDKVNPIAFIFDKDRVTLKLNAVYRTNDGKVEIPNLQLLNTPETTKPLFESIPYQVEVSYQLKNGVATLDKMNVSESDISTSAPAILSNLLGIHTSNSPIDNKRPSAGALLNPLIKGQIQGELKKLLAHEIVFNAVSVPTKVTNLKNGNEKDLEITEAGSLLPVEVKADRGWLAIGNTFCNSHNKAFGVVFGRGATIKSIDENSPAALTGFKPGDKIESFGEPEQRATSVFDNTDSFISFIQEKAGHKTSKARKINVSGKDLQGNSFQRTVFLCPSHLDHLAEAAKGLSRFKKP